MGRSARAFSARAGSVSGIVAAPYREIEQAFANGQMRADVVLIQLVRSPDGSRLGPSLANDYVAVAARHARCVIAEVHPDAPWSQGAELSSQVRIDLQITSQAPLVHAPTVDADATELRIAQHIAQIIPDGATLQTGIGALPDAALRALKGHRRLGLHTGYVADTAIELIERGVITNEAKTIDAGMSVSNTVGGTAITHRHLHNNPAFRLMPAAYTHHPATLAQIDQLYTINTVHEVDLTGQLNSEHDGRNWRGGVGGLSDFIRGSRLSQGGRSIIALASSSRDGRRSRIVPRINSGQIGVARSDTDLVVTEWGVADLRFADLGERARRLIAIADPKFRENLTRAWHESLHGTTPA
jgi:acyl-CoA hydrolase